LTAILVVAAFAFIVVQLSFFEVGQTQMALITELGDPQRVITQPGLHWKMPVLQNAILFDRRLLDFASDPEEVILGDQRRLIVDSFARYRITNPLQYYQTVGPSDDAVRARLESVVNSSLRRVLGDETLLDVLSAQRTRIMAAIQKQVNAEMKSFGVDVIDVRLRRADMPAENTQAILQRMQSERDRVARQARAEGAEAATKIKAEADRQRTVILANATATAAERKGEGEAQAIAIYANAYGRDPQFFSTWRTFQAYKDAFSKNQNHLILTPDNDFLHLLQAPRAAN
ncbi:MAG TPA: protease modulator HflC, partial [Acetobacteraceae bacterium]|nr:protease modulator HflC [Acetobacteraceae bacterium]